MQQRPRRLVAPQPRVLLKLKRRDALLVTSQEEDAQKPDAKRDTGSMEYGPCSDRALISALTALFKASAGQEVTAPAAAARTYKPIRPAGAA